MKKMIGLVLKIIALSLLLFIIFSVSAMVAGINQSVQTADPAGAAMSLLIVCLLFSSVISYPVIRSRWVGWPLVLTIFCLVYGVMTFLTQVETVVFLKYLVDIIPAEMIPKLFLQGFIIAALFSPLAVLVHGKIKGSKEAQSQEPNPRLIMPVRQWIWKLVIVSLIYVVIYLSFGMFVFIPLAGEAFQEYYVDLQMPPWILLFQIGRALVWVALALPIIRMMKGPWWEAGLAVALLFSVLMGALLLIPTEIMPDKIRMAHFFEVTSSNFLFGWIVVWLFNRHHDSWRQLFSTSHSEY